MNCRLLLQGVPKKMFISKKGIRLTNEHFLEHLVYKSRQFILLVTVYLFVAISVFYRMLIIVTVIFFLSWAPLNIFNIVLDIFEPFDNSDEEETKMMLMVFAFCHLSAMTSVCSNPIMYGFLNENFKQTLHSLLFGCCKRNVR